MQVKSLFPVSPRARLMLGTVVVSLAGAFTALAQAQPMDGPHGPGHYAAGGPMGGPMGGRMIARMLDSVNASADQRTRVQAIVKAAADDLRTQHQAARGMHDQMTAVFTAPTVDAGAAEALRQQMLQQHDQSSRRWMQAMLDVSAVLTPEQRALLATTMKQRRDMMERHQRERNALDGK